MTDTVDTTVLPGLLTALRLPSIARHWQHSVTVADREGWPPPKRASFNEPMLHRLLQRHGLGGQRPIWTRHAPRQDEQEWTLQELADQMPVTASIEGPRASR